MWGKPLPCRPHHHPYLPCFYCLHNSIFPFDTLCILHIYPISCLSPQMEQELLRTEISFVQGYSCVSGTLSGTQQAFEKIFIEWVKFHWKFSTPPAPFFKKNFYEIVCRIIFLKVKHNFLKNQTIIYRYTWLPFLELSHRFWVTKGIWIPCLQPSLLPPVFICIKCPAPNTKTEATCFKWWECMCLMSGFLHLGTTDVQGR